MEESGNFLNDLRRQKIKLKVFFLGYIRNCFLIRCSFEDLVVQGTYLYGIGVGWWSAIYLHSVQILTLSIRYKSPFSPAILHPNYLKEATRKITSMKKAWKAIVSRIHTTHHNPKTSTIHKKSSHYGKKNLWWEEIYEVGIENGRDKAYRSLERSQNTCIDQDN